MPFYFGSVLLALAGLVAAWAVRRTPTPRAKSPEPMTAEGPMMADSHPPAAPARGFLRHVHACNRHDLSGFRPFSIAGVTVGQVRIGFMRRLLEMGPPFVPDAVGITLHSDLITPEQRTQAVAVALDRLVEDGTIARLRREMYAVSPCWGAPALMTMDRAAIPCFGVTAHGLHVNGFVRRPDGLYLWVGKRAMDRGVAPGQYDNLVAGGQPAGLSLAENLVKEAWEEAGLTPEMALAGGTGGGRHLSDGTGKGAETRCPVPL